MARSVADVRPLFEALAGYDDRDALSAPVPLNAQPKLDGLRIGVMEQFYDVPVQAAVRTAVREAAKVLDGLGFAVDAFLPGGIERAPNLWSFFFSELPARAMRERIAGREAEAQPDLHRGARTRPRTSASFGLAGYGIARRAGCNAPETARADAESAHTSVAGIEHRGFPAS